jgi:hypothetical protein
MYNSCTSNTTGLFAGILGLHRNIDDQSAIFHVQEQTMRWNNTISDTTVFEEYA